MNIVALAAGSGKTSRSLALAKDLILEGFNITYVSITNVSVEDAKHRFRSQYSEVLSEEQMNMFKISTVHSYCLELIRASRHFKDVEILTTTEYTPLDKELDVLASKSNIEPFKSFILSKVEEYTKTHVLAINKKINPTAITEIQGESETDTPAATQLQPSVEAGAGVSGTQIEYKRRLILPLDWVLHVCKAWGLKPPNNDAIMIDEYQDMDSKELYAISEIFEDRAWLFGDPNQVLYIFRIKGDVYRPVESVVLEKVETHRFDQKSCENLTRLLTYKNALLPIGSSPIVDMYSNKAPEVPNSMELIPWDRVIDWSKVAKGRTSVDWRKYCSDRLIYEPMRQIIENSKDSFQIVCTGNGIASKYSDIISRQFGDILTSWYIPVYSHPLYRKMRDLLRGSHTKQAPRLARTVYRTLTKLGYNVDQNKIEGILDYIRESGTLKAGQEVPNADWLNEAIAKMADRYLDNKLKGSYKASNKSNFQSAVNVMQMICSKGLKAALSGVQLQSENPKRGRITTIHSSKGTESDWVLLDLQGQFRGPAKAQDLLQNLNALYVGMSRHRKKLWVTMDEGYQDIVKEMEDGRVTVPPMIRNAFEAYGITRGFDASEIDATDIYGQAQVYYPDLIGLMICMAVNEKLDAKNALTRIFPY